MRFGAGRNKADILISPGVNFPYAITDHVGDVENLPGRIKLDVLWHRGGLQQNSFDQRFAGNVDLGQLAAELTRSQERFAIGGEIDVINAVAINVQTLFQSKRVWITEIEILLGLGYHNRPAAIRREIHVVGIVHRNVGPGRACR